MIRSTWFLGTLFLPLIVIGQSSGAIKIAESPAFPIGICEPSIAIDPKDPSRMVAGAILNGFYYSSDSGKTWQDGELSSSYGVWGDPCIIADDQGNFYYFHLSDPSGMNWSSSEILDRIVVQKSTDGGMTWSDGSFMGYAHPKDQDKEWASFDPVTGRLFCTWTQFDKYESKDPADESNILFSSSFDRGETWTAPVSINQIPGNCLDDDGTVEGAVPAPDPYGNLHVAWALNEGIYFTSSLDGGISWPDTNIYVAEQVGGWTMKVKGIQRCNGMPVTACDLSQGPYRGTIYICYSDKRNGETNSDVFLVRSLDGGKTWSKPIRVNDDETKTEQFFPWLAVDPVTGYLAVVFYDRRNHDDDLTTDVYLAWSKDAGQTWVNEKINEGSFKPHPFVFFGDYNNIAIYNGVVRPIWTELIEKKLSIWTSLYRIP
ncbi:MAG: glycoside hydrolase [Bacteroidota bacterium]|nr:glycoside hydrolase [Bacteroidota bacterium]